LQVVDEFVNSRHFGVDSSLLHAIFRVIHLNDRFVRFCRALLESPPPFGESVHPQRRFLLRCQIFQRRFAVGNFRERVRALASNLNRLATKRLGVRARNSNWLDIFHWSRVATDTKTGAENDDCPSNFHFRIVPIAAVQNLLPAPYFSHRSQHLGWHYNSLPNLPVHFVIVYHKLARSGFSLVHPTRIAATLAASLECFAYHEGVK
jgi:hypothetical protein